MEVIKLKVGDSNKNVIKILKECLEIAEKGGIENAAIIMLHEDCAITDVWANGIKPYEMLGGFRALEHDFMNRNIENRND